MPIPLSQLWTHGLTPGRHHSQRMAQALAEGASVLATAAVIHKLEEGERGLSLPEALMASHGRFDEQDLVDRLALVQRHLPNPPVHFWKHVWDAAVEHRAPVAALEVVGQMLRQPLNISRKEALVQAVCQAPVDEWNAQALEWLTLRGYGPNKWPQARQDELAGHPDDGLRTAYWKAIKPKLRKSSGPERH